LTFPVGMAILPNKFCVGRWPLQLPVTRDVCRAMSTYSNTAQAANLYPIPQANAKQILVNCQLTPHKTLAYCIQLSRERCVPFQALSAWLVAVYTRRPTQFLSGGVCGQYVGCRK
jgi:hypothetical protein